MSIRVGAYHSSSMLQVERRERLLVWRQSCTLDEYWKGESVIGYESTGREIMPYAMRVHARR
eukprot:3789153-Rhodomonas_salina.1